MSGQDRELSDLEREQRGLPGGGCCCPEHGHLWYERTHDGQTWLECNRCGDQVTEGQDDLAGTCTCGHRWVDHHERDGCGACAMAFTVSCKRWPL
jgi:hypothetical protein